MKSKFHVLFLLIPTALLVSQNTKILTQSDLVKIPNEYTNKVVSGKLIEHISKKNFLAKSNSNQVASTKVALYFEKFPASEQFHTLDNLAIEYYTETWIPPTDNHPLGFLLASLPNDKLNETLSCNFLKKIDTAEKRMCRLNNDGTMSVRANMLWHDGYEGSGVTIGILDSGLDLSYAGTDLPPNIEYKDYSEYPDLDDTIENTVTGHGTHVAASALGRGALSAGHTHWNNGKGPFKGSAPMADLVFLKIGLDEDGWATDAGMIGAIIAGVNTYNADILSMSYGGWDVYHDGSLLLDQTIDWAYDQGVLCFASAGNSANDYKHWSGTLPPNSESDFIRISVNEANADDTMLSFNLVWNDGENRNDLSLQYFDSTLQPLVDITHLPTTESDRGTESQYSYYNNYLPSGDGTYYLKVVNNSQNNQFCHIYEEWANTEDGTYNVYFPDADPNYTIGSPAQADYCIAVGAYVSKIGWTDPDDGSWWWGPSYIINDIATFSSLGPRIDGLIKPDICAPGHVVVSLRDTDVYTEQTKAWIDNNGIMGEGDANYYRMRGTSMACPIAAGSAALYLEKHPGATPQQVYNAIKNTANQTGINAPNNTWGNGRLDIYAAARGYKYPINVDGDMTDVRYQTLATYTSGRNGYGDDNDLGAIKFYSDGENIYIGITGEVTSNDNIVLFFDFSGVQGRGNNILYGGNSGDFVYNVFAYLVNERLDFDADFGIAFNEGNSTQFEFFADAIRYGSNTPPQNVTGFVAKSNQYGASATSDISPIFGGNSFATIAYDSSYALDNNKGFEMSIPISAFAGVDASQTLRLFAMISSMVGDVSNECIPGDPGPANLGNGANFAAIPNQEFFTQPVKISGTEFVSIGDKESIIHDFVLEQNYPNPFNATTNIKFLIPFESQINLNIYDLNGRLLKTLVNNREFPSGYHNMIWNGTDNLGNKISSGIYIAKLKVGNKEKVRKMLLLQ